MAAVLIALVLVVLLGALVMSRSVRTVAPSHTAVIERLGRYLRTRGPGLAVMMPFVDRVRTTVDLREQTISVPQQLLPTSDGATVGVDASINLQVTDPRAATYEIANYAQAVEQITVTALRGLVGSMPLGGALSNRAHIVTELHQVLDQVALKWGLRFGEVRLDIARLPIAART